MSIKRTIITTVVALAVVAVVAPTVTQATTVADLMAQIAALQAQLQGLSGTTTTTTSGTGLCAGVTFTRNLTVGSTGNDVKCLQQILSVTPTSGYFGPKTLAAVRAYQTSKGFTPANQVGPMTRAALNAQLSTTTSTTPVTPVGSITATVAATNPAAGALINSQAQANLLDIAFSGSGTVTTLTLKRTGISDQNTLTNVYLYDGAVRLTDGYSFNINGTTTISGLNIAVSGTKVISVKADVYSSATTNSSSIAVALTGFNGGVANVQGNTMQIVAGTAAGASFAVGGNTYAGTTPHVNAGTSQYTSWADTLTITTRAIQLKGMSLKMIGSAPSNALTNVKLFVDGVDSGRVATVVTVQGSTYEMFDFSASPVTLTTGGHTLEVRADITTGSNRTMQLSLQTASDIVLFDSQIGVNIAPLKGTGAFAASTGANMEIQTGSSTIVVDPTFNTQTTVAAGATNVTIGKFTIHGYGEDVKVSDLYITPQILSASASGTQTCVTGTDGAWSAGTCGLNNVTLYLNGVQVGSQKNWTMSSNSNSTAGGDGTLTADTGIDFSLGSQMIIPAGQDSTLEIKADLQNASSINYVNGTVVVTVVGQSSANAIGQVSQANVTFPGSDVTTSGLAVSSASLQVAKNTALADYTAAPNTSNVKIGSFVLQNQSTSEAVRLTTLTVGLYDNGFADLTSTELTGLAALRTSDTTGSGSTPIQPTLSNTFSVSDVLQPNESKTIDIYANVGSSSLISAVATKLTVASIGVSSNVSNAGSAKNGQVVTFGTGTIATPTKMTSGTTATQYVVGNSTNASQVTFGFISTSGASTISELKFQVTGTDANPTQTVTNVCIGTLCAQPINNVVDLTGLSLSVPNGGAGLQQPVTVSYAPVGTGGVTPNVTSTLSLTYVKYTSGGTTKTMSSAATAGNNTQISPVDGNAIYLVGGKPTVVVATGGSKGMVLNQSTKVGQATVTATGGDIKVRQIQFNVTWAGYNILPTTVTAASLTDAGGNTLTDFTCTPASSGTISSGANVVTCTTVADYASEYLIAKGASQEFDLYVTTSGGQNTTGTPTASSSLVKGSFVWSDTSFNGVGSAGVGLSGTYIYGFPTNSYTVSQ